MRTLVRGALACLCWGLTLSSAVAAEPDWPQAIAGLRAHLAASPEDADRRRALAVAHNDYAVALAERAEWDLAEFHGEEAVRLDPGDQRPRDNLAQIRLRHGLQRYQAGLAAASLPGDAAAIRGLAERALAASPELVAAHVLLGDLEYALGQRDAAAVAWWRAQALAPNLDGLAERLALVREGGGPDAPGGGPAPAAAPADLAGTVEKLRERRRLAPNDERLRGELAAAHHVYGLALASGGDWDGAFANLRSAVRLAPEVGSYRQSLARVSLDRAAELRRGLGRGLQAAAGVEEARHLVTQAVEADPGLAPAHLLLGDLEYDLQRLDRARQAWRRAGELDPGLDGLTERLRRLDGEHAVEARMQGVEDGDFVLQYEEEVGGSLGFDVRALLHDARRTVGQALGHWPRRRIVVLLYRLDTYRRVRHQAPVWSTGLYDGKIRVPVPGTAAEVRMVAGTVVHEYVHAVVDDLAGGRCPPWLNEGLAERFEAAHGSRDAPGAVRAAARGGQLIPWSRVDQALRSPSAEEARRAYDQAHSMVAYLAATHGDYGLRRVLDALGAGADPDAAMTREFGLTPAELELGWRRWLAGPT